MNGFELRRVLDILPDLVVQFDRNARFSYFNPAVLHALQATSDQLGGWIEVDSAVDRGTALRWYFLALVT